jgi:subtilisin family serine protease/ligand-binding sensor domain-containing protein
LAKASLAGQFFVIPCLAQTALRFSYREDEKQSKGKACNQEENIMRKTKLTSTLTTIFLLAFFVLSSVQPVSSRPIESSRMQEATTYPYVPDVILIGIQAGVTLEVNSKDNPAQPYKTDSAALERALKSIGVRSLEPLFSSELIRQIAIQAPAGESLTTYRLRLTEGTDIQAAVKELAALSDVRFAEPDYIAFPADAPASASMPILAPAASQLTIDDPLYAQQWGLARINIEGAWDDTYGSPIVTIAIVDSGIDLTHVDLAGNLWVNPGEIANNGLDDDSNGFVDDVNGWNFISGSKDVSDENGHGTLVAGVAAAIGGNGQGIAGVCPQCRIMPVKVTQTSGTANYSDVAAGVLYAAQKGAKVINISLGGYANSNILKNAIDTAVNGYGAVVVAGAGNDNLNQSFYPAAYENVLAVAGTQIDDTKVATSNYGAWVDVTAPGLDIRTTALGGGWLDNSGTSFAAPFASGLAGLLKALHPDWSQALIRSQITHTADNVDGVNPALTGLLGSGRINAGSAMQTPHPVLQVAGYSVNGLANGRPVLGATSNMIVTLNNDWWDAPNVTGTLSTADPYVSVTNGSASFGSIPAGATAVNATAFTFSVNPAAGYNHPISFNLAVSDTNGYATALNFTVTTEAGLVNKSGTIVADETWTNDKTYLIVNNVNIPSGVTLTIQPGTTIKFNGNYSLNVRGALLADASASQPIFFKSNTAGAWDRIYFDDTSLDAVADGSGGYLSGSILRHVNIESSTGGIDCTTATPYLAHLNLTGGGVACTLGATPIWFMDNTISGGASFTGNGSAFRNKVTGGLSISGAGILEENVVSGGILSLGSGIARRNTAASGLSVGGSGGAMEENTVTGNVNIGDSFTVTKNTIIGKLTVGNAATVDHNTVSNGITVGSSATVTWNNVEDAEGTCLISGDGVTAQFNRLIGCGSGMSATSGLIEHNLIANNEGVGLQVGAATVQYNTLTGNAGYTILVQGGMPLSLSNNNLELNSGTFDIYSNIASGSGSIPAQNNWWGTTDGTLISDRIYDYSDDDLKAPVAYSPTLTGPDQTAPGYVRAVNVLPDNTLGIQTGTFEALFSKPMDTNNSITMQFSNKRWFQYTPANSGLPNSFGVRTIAIETNGTKWFGTYGAGVASFDGSTWNTYDNSNSGLPGNWVWASAIEPNGTKWFGLTNGIASYNGTSWKVFNSSNSKLSNESVVAIAIEANGKKWFGTSVSGVDSLDGTIWNNYNTYNSGLPHNYVSAIAIDANGMKWLGTYGGGVASFDGSIWTVYNESNSDLPSDNILTIKIDTNGKKWFGTDGGGVASFDGSSWDVYNKYNSGLSRDSVAVIAIEPNNTKWFGSSIYSPESGVDRFDGSEWIVYKASNSELPDDNIHVIEIDKSGQRWFGTTLGIGMLHGVDGYAIIDNQQWLSSTVYRATYDINTNVIKDTYRVSLINGQDLDGMHIAQFSDSVFSVDYAGSISDTTPPQKPIVTALWNGGKSSISANWISSDPESPITMYRYAIGTTAGTRDIVDWTYTTNPSVVHNGLNLVTGVPYYVLVAARNEGGLWSENGLAEVRTFADVYSTYWAWSYIERLYNAGITGGCATTPNLLYCPDNTVTRAQMAVFLLKSMHGPTFTPPLVGDSTGFGDVTTSHWAAAWIKQLAAEGITGGCGNGNYCPEAPVTRGQMAVFLLKAKNGSGYIPPMIGGGSGFTDVPDNYWAAVWIKQLAADGITGGCGAGIYCPENPVTRAQMAVFIVKTFGLP